MNIEYEATFENINKNNMRERLKKTGAVLIKPEVLMKRKVFNFPTGHEVAGAWLRVRDEGDKTTMSLKIINGDKIEDQKEICFKIDDFEEGVNFMKLVGCEQKSYQETKRELWIMDDVEITIDEWPYLEPIVEIEGKSEKAVKAVSEKLGFDYSKALFCGIDLLYNRKYGTPFDIINKHTKFITFETPNPFIK